MLKADVEMNEQKKFEANDISRSLDCSLIEMKSAGRQLRRYIIPAHAAAIFARE